MEQALDQAYEWVTLYGLKVIGAIVILIIGRFAAGLIKRVLSRVMTKANTDPAVISFAGSLSYFLVLTFAVLAALAKFGVQTTSFVAVLGAAGLAVGLALQGSLSNFAAGVLILVLKPFKIGDFVEIGGETGTVREIQLFTTTLSTGDNVKILIPNSQVLGRTIKNVTAFDTRRVDMVMGIGYDAPIGEAIEIMQQILADDERVLKDPAPVIAVNELADSSVNLVVRPWVNKSDYWAVKWDFTRQAKEAFDEAGIDIPYPQTVVHLNRAEEG